MKSKDTPVERFRRFMRNNYSKIILIGYKDYAALREYERNPPISYEPTICTQDKINLKKKYGFTKIR